MKVYLIFNYSQMKDMTLEEVKRARDRFDLFASAYVRTAPNLIAWEDIGVDGEEIYKVGVTDIVMPEDELQRIGIPKNEQGIFGEGIDLSLLTPDKTFLWEK